MHSSRHSATSSTGLGLGLGLVLPPPSLASIRLPSGARAPSPTPAHALDSSQDDPHHTQNNVQHSAICLTARDAATAILAPQSNANPSLSVDLMAAYSAAVLALPTPHHLAPYLTPLLPAALHLLGNNDLADWPAARMHALRSLEHILVSLCTQPYSRAQHTSAHLLRRSNWHLVLWQALLDRIVLTTVEAKDEVSIVGSCLIGLMDLRADYGVKVDRDDKRNGEKAQAESRSGQWMNDWAEVVQLVLKVLESQPKMHAELRLEFTRLLTQLLSLTSTCPTVTLTYARRCITQLALAIQWLSSARPNSALQQLGIHALTQVRTLFLDPWSTPLPPPVRRQLPRLLASLVMASAGALDAPPISVQEASEARTVWAHVRDRIRREYEDEQTWDADVAMVRQAISGMSDEVLGKANNTGGGEVDVGVIQIGVEEMSV